MQPPLVEEIKALQKDIAQLQKIREEVKASTRPGFTIHSDESLRFGSRVYIPNTPELIKKVLNEAHNSIYTMHPRGTQIHKRLKGDSLVKQHEQRDCKKFRNTSVEMEKDHYRFCHRIVKLSKGK